MTSGLDSLAGVALVVFVVGFMGSGAAFTGFFRAELLVALDDVASSTAAPSSTRFRYEPRS